MGRSLLRFRSRKFCRFLVGSQLGFDFRYLQRASIYLFLSFLVLSSKKFKHKLVVFVAYSMVVIM